MIVEMIHSPGRVWVLSVVSVGCVASEVAVFLEAGVEEKPVLKSKGRNFRLCDRFWYSF